MNSVFLSADGRYTLSGGCDETLKLWEISSGRCLRTFEGHTYSVKSVLLSPDGLRPVGKRRQDTEALGRRDGQVPADL